MTAKKTRREMGMRVFMDTETTENLRRVDAEIGSGMQQELGDNTSNLAQY